MLLYRGSGRQDPWESRCRFTSWSTSPAIAELYARYDSDSEGMHAHHAEPFRRWQLAFTGKVFVMPEPVFMGVPVFELFWRWDVHRDVLEPLLERVRAHAVSYPEWTPRARQWATTYRLLEVETFRLKTSPEPVTGWVMGSMCEKAPGPVGRGGRYQGPAVG